MRLDRFLSQAAGISRSQARALIRQGRIAVDGARVRDPGQPLAPSSKVTLDEGDLALPGPAYLMMHKPTGLLSASRDGQQPTVMGLLPPQLIRRVHLVGRLDKETSGLLLLTDDGAWSHRVASPRHHRVKTYRAMLAEPLVADAETRLAEGLVLRNEARPTAPASLTRLGPCEVAIGVTEGRYHLVRRMFAALGNRVTALHRERIGALALDPLLAPGEWRYLDPDEREAVFRGPQTPATG